MTGQEIINALTPSKDKEIELVYYDGKVEFWADNGETELFKIKAIE